MIPAQFLQHVIRPTLLRLDHGRHDEAVENLLLGTAIVESGGLNYLRQIGGPALGLYQIEPDTHQDIWDSFLAYRDDLASKVRAFASQGWADYDYDHLHAELITNLAYATAVARVHYLRVPDLIPDDVTGQAAYWKAHYNTSAGRGSVDHYLALWHKHYATDFS